MWFPQKAMKICTSLLDPSWLRATLCLCPHCMCYLPTGHSVTRRQHWLVSPSTCRFSEHAASLGGTVVRYSTVGTLLAPVDAGNLRRPHQAEALPASDSRPEKLPASHGRVPDQEPCAISGTVHSLLNSVPLYRIMTFSNYILK